MERTYPRRDVLALMGLGGLVFASGLPGCAASGAWSSSTPSAPGAARRRVEDFLFLQLSDTHWGYSGAANPMADVTLERTIKAVNAADLRPDFVVFTGDLTHATGDPGERRERMKRFRDIASRLAVPRAYYLAGEHDASFDEGEAYLEVFGPSSYAFDHKGVHFVALDNASRKGGALGDAQLEWLANDLARLEPDAPVVVFAHRPLFPLFPDWEWQTTDGARAIQLLDARAHVTVFYGHIHQEHHFHTGRVAHHAARSLIFPLPVPGSVPTKAPLSWDAASPDHGLGWRSVALSSPPPSPTITEMPFR